LRLSGFLRVTLDGGSDESTLREEAQFVEQYLGIETIRFSDRLRYELCIESSALDCRVPHLILQPLVENAIRHGLDNEERGGTIRVSARHIDGGALELAVSDDGAGLAVAEPQYGVGLSNVQKRLAAWYGRAASLHLTSNADGGTTATVRIPESRPCLL
jgi:two-component system LytT family sensor kinase